MSTLPLTVVVTWEGSVPAGNGFEGVPFSDAVDSIYEICMTRSVRATMPETACDIFLSLKLIRSRCLIVDGGSRRLAGKLYVQHYAA